MVNSTVEQSVGQPVAEISEGKIGARTAGHLAYLRNGWASMINHAMWSISVEWRIYFLFPLLVWVWSRKGPLAVLIAAGLLTTAYYLFLSKTHLFNWACCPQYILLFSFGMLSSLSAYLPNRSQRSKFLAIVSFVVAAPLIKLAIHVDHSLLAQGDHYSMLFDVMAGLVAAAVLGYAAVKPASKLTRTLSWKPLAFVGTFAYSI